MAYFEIDTKAGVLGYNTKENTNEVVLTACRGRDVNIDIPETVNHVTGNSYKVTAIGRKAFLSDKYLHSIVIPQTVKVVGDWAFAGCRKLETITMYSDVTLENAVFKDCNSLAQVVVKKNGDFLCTDEKRELDVSYMLAAVIGLLEDKYLFDLRNSGNDDWIEQWDKRMEVILDEPDEEGFANLLACGEEDYEGRDNTLEAYLNRRRCRKVRVCLIRLLHDFGLSKERHDKLVKYLYEHRAGAYEDETWQVVLAEHGDDEEYFELMNACGCITSDNIDVMLTDMGERHARMKAFLLRLGNDGTSDDFFDDMEL